MSKAYIEGRNAAKYCIARNSDAHYIFNPYAYGTQEHKDWQRGFDQSLKLEQP